MLRLHGHGDSYHHGHSIPHWLPGLALLAGFLVMLIFEFEHHHAEHEQPGRDSSSKVRSRLRPFLVCQGMLVCRHASPL